MDGEGSVRLQKADRGKRNLLRLKWVALHGGLIKGLWKSPFVLYPDVGFV